MSAIEFESDPWLRAAELLAQADEPERALKLLELLPGYYRDNPPPELVALRRTIEASLFQVHDYMDVPGDMPKTDEQVEFWINHVCRGNIMMQDLKEANQSGIIPHLVDMGPGDYMLPIGLVQLGLRFTYRPILLEKNAKSAAHDRIASVLVDKDPTDKPIWFVAYEIIEHIWNPTDLAGMAWRCATTPERIYLSTPQYTFARGHKTWRVDKQPHLRTYTPREFIDTAQNLFQGYNWEYINDPVMVLRGRIKT